MTTLFISGNRCETLGLSYITGVNSLVSLFLITTERAVRNKSTMQDMIDWAKCYVNVCTDRSLPGNVQ